VQLNSPSTFTVSCRKPLYFLAKLSHQTHQELIPLVGVDDGLYYSSSCVKITEFSFLRRE